MGRIGLTTTVPVEIILAAGHTPVDMNNIFITSPAAAKMVQKAEEAGYPRNCCGWIKGLYAVAIEDYDIDQVIAVTQGDCSNTHALMETYELKGLKTIPFAYPQDRDYDLLKLQMEKLMKALGTNWEEVYAVRNRLRSIRRKLAELDRLTWTDEKVSGFDNHIWQVCSSDFNTNPDQFEQELDAFLAKAKENKPKKSEIRLGFMGVPPIFTDLYEVIEEAGGQVVFNEVQRQFAMPYEVDDLVEQYRLYTYPYGVFYRLEDIQKEVEQRQLDGMIHYVQSFCFRQIEDMIYRDKLDLPILTIEGDAPGKVDARTRLRIESFLEMLR